MTFAFQAGDQTFLSSRAENVIFIMLIAILSLGGSFAFACAMPLVAIAALVAVRMDSKMGLAVIITAWLSNQIVGYGFLHYPQNFESFTWCAAIGIATIAAFVAAHSTVSLVRFEAVFLLISFLAAFVTYELVLFIAGIPLGTLNDAFSISVIAGILEVNTVSFVSLLALHWLLRNFALHLKLAEQAS